VALRRKKKLLQAKFSCRIKATEGKLVPVGVLLSYGMPKDLPTMRNNLEEYM
jgi:hypothetical protein